MSPLLLYFDKTGRRSIYLLTKWLAYSSNLYYFSKAFTGKMANRDVLMPRESGQFIAKHSKHVTISSDGVRSTATKMFDMLKAQPELLNGERWSLHELNPSTQDQKAIDWIFVCDVLNFSFWSEDEMNIYTVEYKGKAWTGYWSLCAAINRALDEGIPFCDPKFYGQVTMEQLHHVFRSDSDVEMPMMCQRKESLHEAGKVLEEKFGGTFVNVVKAANKSAQNLLRLIIKNFPSFRDESHFEGKTVGIYKRAQIVIGDIWACCSGKGFGQFDDIDTITMFADYRIPQCLVWFGVLKYSNMLMEKLNKGVLLKSGDREEVEIRGCSIWAVELIVESIRDQIAKDSRGSPDMHVNAIVLDHFLWDYRREHANETKHIPIHKIRCIYY